MLANPARTELLQHLSDRIIDTSNNLLDNFSVNLLYDHMRDNTTELAEPIQSLLVRLCKSHPQQMAIAFSQVLPLCPNTSEDHVRFVDDITKLCDKAENNLAKYYFFDGLDMYVNGEPDVLIYSLDTQADVHAHMVDLMTHLESRTKIRYAISEHVKYCDDCNEWELVHDARETYAQTFVCRTCIDKSYTYIGRYGCYVHEDDIRTAISRSGRDIEIHYEDEDYNWSDHHDCYVHSAYEAECHDMDEVLTEYHAHKNLFRPISSTWTDINKRFFGVELEVEVTNRQRLDVVHRINDAVNDGEVGQHCFFEKDGSLSYGFEIITQPMGLDTHKDFWKWLTTDTKKDLLSHKTTSCGLHIHVSRQHLSKLQLSKIVTFANSPDNKPLIKAIARRYGTSYASIQDKKLGNAWKDQRDRREAINLQSTNTIEFRLFRGSLKYESVMAAIQFTNALVLYCSDTSGYGFDLSSQSFMKFAASPDMVEDTNFLLPYLEQRSFENNTGE